MSVSMRRGDKAAKAEGEERSGPECVDCRSVVGPTSVFEWKKSFRWLDGDRRGGGRGEADRNGWMASPDGAGAEAVDEEERRPLRFEDPGDPAVEIRAERRRRWLDGDRRGGGRGARPERAALARRRPERRRERRGRPERAALAGRRPERRRPTGTERRRRERTATAGWTSVAEEKWRRGEMESKPVAEMGEEKRERDVVPSPAMPSHRARRSDLEGAESHFKFTRATGRCHASRSERGCKPS